MCEHRNIIIVSKYYPPSWDEPPETEIIRCICKDCEEDVDFMGDSYYDSIEDIDISDWIDYEI